MNANKLFEEFEKLDDREQIRFINQINRHCDKFEKQHQEKRQKMYEELKATNHFSDEWLKINILNIPKDEV